MSEYEGPTTAPQELGGFRFFEPVKRPGLEELPEGYTEFDYDIETHRLHVIGYSTDETRDLLSMYREHLQLLADFTQRHQVAADAYRSGPGDIQPGL
jgi:hypothetical protein